MASDDIDNVCSINSLEHLQKLEENENLETELRKGALKRQKEVEALQRTIKKLKGEKRELQERLDNNQYRILHRFIQNEPGGRKSVIHRKLNSEQTAQLEGSLKKARQMKAEEMLLSYRLTGATIKPISNSEIRICWDTFHRDEFFESFYAKVKMTDLTKLESHSIPFFIPLQRLIDQYLSKDMESFVQAVGNYLNAYISRRQQAIDLQKVYQDNMIGEVHTASAFDFMQIFLKVFGDDVILDMSLTYENLLNMRPTKVVLKISGDVDDSTNLHDQLVELKNDLKTLSLADAVDKFLN